MEMLEELKRKMMAKIYYREGIPEEVTNIIQKAFDGISDRYKELHCNNSSIQEYIQENLNYVKAYLKNNLGEKRKENQMEQLQYIIGKMQKDLEDGDKTIEKPKAEEKNRDMINQIEPEDKKITLNIIDIIEELLRDTQSRQSKVLDANEFSIDRIEEIKGETGYFIQGFLSKNEERIYEILVRDNEALKQQLLDEYEEYLLQNKKEEKQERDNKSRREEFIEELNAGISLDEQKEFLLKQAEQKDKSVKSLPDNVIE